MSTQPQFSPEPRREPSARDVLAPLRRARELQLEGQYSAAESRYRAVLRLEPRQPQALFHLALLLESLGRPVEALRHLRTAIDVDPNLPEARGHLDALLAKLGRR